MGEPFSGCLKRLRIERAMQLLRGPDVPQGRIAAQLGFSDQFAFSHFFKKVTGYSPTEFRKRGNPTHKNSRRRL
jgi:two-component system response regulator YesN